MPRWVATRPWLRLGTGDTAIPGGFLSKSVNARRCGPQNYKSIPLVTDERVEHTDLVILDGLGYLPLR